jgi:hypothetical protein
MLGVGYGSVGPICLLESRPLVREPRPYAWPTRLRCRRSIADNRHSLANHEERALLNGMVVVET